jgi:protein-S-isoprenylcysteine O-methyltransferase Ste14
MLTRVGGWLFRNRTVIPVPIVLALLIIPPSRPPLWLGIFVTAAGEVLRLSAVRHIGTVSRTRTDRLGPLVASGPFRWVRNPLYIGNVAIWIGLALVAGLPWLVIPIALVLALEYHAIVRWEEQLLASRLGQPYAEYMRTVPRWVPRPPDREASTVAAVFGWRETFFSERGTLIAIAVGLVLLWIKGKSEF